MIRFGPVPTVLAAVLLLAAPESALARQDAARDAVSGDAPVRPRMTALVRAALTAPGDSLVWGEMAELLPEMARVGEASVLGAFEAGRVADSLSRAPVDPVALALESGRSVAERTRAGRLDASSVTAAGLEPTAADASSGAGIVVWTIPWIAVALLGGAGWWIGRRRAGSPVSPDASRTPRSGGRSDRMWAVTTLAESGLPPSEIARRTGMAQDAVRVLMGLGGASPSGSVATPPSGPAMTAGAERPPTLGERAAGVSAERMALLRQARRMKDGRITYGPRAAR